MFDDRDVWAYGQSSVVERALRGWLGLPETVYELTDDYLRHGPDEPYEAGAAARSPQQSSRAPGIHVSDEFARLLETGASHLAAAKAAFVEQSRQAGAQARALAAFAAHRPARVLDRPDDEVGAAAAASRSSRPAVLTEVSEWAVDEVMASLGLPSRAAGQLLSQSVTLAEKLPATLTALEAGQISWGHARMLADRLGSLSDEVRPEVEATLLAKAAGKTVAQLQEAARRAVLKADASAAVERMARAIKDRSIRVYDEEDGISTLSASMSSPVASACYKALEAHAEACQTPGDERTKEQRMSDCMVDLILRSGADDRPPVQVLLTMVASAGTLTGGDEPGEIDGQPVPAMLIREMAYALGLLPRPADAAPAAETATAAEAAAETESEPEADGQAGTADPVSANLPDSEPAATTELASTTELGAGDAPDEGTTAPPASAGQTSDSRGRAISRSEQAAADLAALLGIRTTAGTALAAPPIIAIVSEISGQLLSLTDAWEIRRAATCDRRACRRGRRPCTHPPSGPGLGPPPSTDAYTPSAPLDRFVRARDRRCRFPGCRARPRRCDLDHNVPWPAGPTSEANLCCLCRHHHRLSHQAPGWTMRRLPDGGIEWITPGGDRLVTHPIPYGTDDISPRSSPPGPNGNREPIPVEPPLTAIERVVGRPLPPGAMDDDPPPF